MVWSTVRCINRLAVKTIGYVDTPLLSNPPLTRVVNEHGYDSFDLAKLTALSDQEKAHTVLIVQDPFTSFYDAQTVASMMLLAKKTRF